MGTTTANYGLYLPTPNDPVDQDQWGTELNNDLSELDAIILTAINDVTSTQTSAFSVTAPTPGSSTIGSANALFLCDATSGLLIATLPSASSAGNGFVVSFKKIDVSTNGVAVTPVGSDKIDGQATYTLAAQWSWVELVSDGTSKWSILSNNFTAQTNNVSDMTIMSNISGSTAAPSANTLTSILDEIIGSSQGTFLYRGASVWKALAYPATAGKTITSGGTGADPSWGNAGGLLYIATANASAQSSVIFNNTYITTAYNKYVVEFDGMFSNGSLALLLDVSINNGSTYTGSPATMSLAADTNNGAIGTIKIGNVNSGTFFVASSVGVARDGTPWNLGGTFSPSGTVNTIKLTNVGLLSGNFHLYGLVGT